MIYLLDHYYNIIDELESIHSYNEKYNDFLHGEVTMMGRCFLNPTKENKEGLGYIFNLDNVMTKDYTSERWEVIKNNIKIYERDKKINHLLI